MRLSILIHFLSLIILSSCASNSESDPVEKTVEQKKAEIYYNQGTSDLIAKNYNQALVNLMKAAQFDPKDDKIRTNLGMAYYFKEQFELAEKELKSAIDLNPKNSDAKMNLGVFYLEKNKLKEAKNLFQNVTEDLTFPSQFRNYYNLAMINLKEGDRKTAFINLNKSIKEKEDYCQAHFKKGELFNEEYRFKEALISFREATKGECVREPAPHYQQALTLINLNRTNEASKKLKEIIEKFPQSKFQTLAQIQLKKINLMTDRDSQTAQTEVIKESKNVESPNF